MIGLLGYLLDALARCALSDQSEWPHSRLTEPNLVSIVAQLLEHCVGQPRAIAHVGEEVQWRESVRRSESPHSLVSVR